MFAARHQLSLLKLVAQKVREAEQSFEVEWESNAFPGWSQSAAEAAHSLVHSNDGDIDLNKYSSAQVGMPNPS